MRNTFIKLMYLLFFSITAPVVVKANDFDARFQVGLSWAKLGNYGNALIEWMPLAQAGHAWSQYNLGALAENGTAVPQDFKNAIKWYTLAAVQGLYIAQNQLGMLYAHGKGVPKDQKEALKWWTLAAKQGYA